MRVVYNITARCNLNCKHCYVTELEAGGELSTEDALKVIEEVWRCFGSGTKVILSGGEPMMRKDVYEIVSYTSRMGLQASLATNGTLIDEEAALRLKKAGLSEVSISLEAPSSTIHDYVRGEGSFEKALVGIRACRRVGLKTFIDPCIFNFNVSQVLEVIDFAEKIGAEGLRIFHYVIMGRGREALPYAYLTREEHERWLKRLYDEQIRRPNLSINVAQAPQYVVLLARGVGEGDPVALRMYEELKPGCRAAVKVISVKHDGKVTPCPLWTYSLGNINTQSLREILSSKLVLKLRDKKRYLKGRCSLCIYAEVCGGCRIRSYEATGDYFGEDPLCSGAFYEPSVK